MHHTEAHTRMLPFIIRQDGPFDIETLKCNCGEKIPMQRKVSGGELQVLVGAT